MNTIETSELDLRILTSLRRIIRAVDIYSRKLNSELGLTTPQLLCLYALQRNDNMTISQLAKEINLGASTVIGIVDRLEAKGYANRNRSTKDRRKVFIDLTPSGLDVVTKAPSLLQENLSASFSRLDLKSQINITESLEKVVSLMEAEDIDASPNLISTSTIGTDAHRV
mgnify:CR=1 FL=1